MSHKRPQNRKSDPRSLRTCHGYRVGWRNPRGLRGMSAYDAENAAYFVSQKINRILRQRLPGKVCTRQDTTECKPRV